MRPRDSPGPGSRLPWASSKKARPSSAVRKTKVEVWKMGLLAAPSDHSGL